MAISHNGYILPPMMEAGLPLNTSCKESEVEKTAIALSSFLQAFQMHLGGHCEKAQRNIFCRHPTEAATAILSYLDIGTSSGGGAMLFGPPQFFLRGLPLIVEGERGAGCKGTPGLHVRDTRASCWGPSMFFRRWHFWQ